MKPLRPGPFRSSPPDQRGAVTLWVVFMATAVFCVAGLVLDGGHALSAKRDAARLAEQAARVGADQLDTDGLRKGKTAIEPRAARAAAQQYLANADASGTVWTSGATVSVTVTRRTEAVILSAFGVPGYTVSSTASARSIDDSEG